MEQLVDNSDVAGHEYRVTCHYRDNHTGFDFLSYNQGLPYCHRKVRDHPCEEVSIARQY